MNTAYTTSGNCLEIGVDEAGRGPLFGRVYAAAVILPKEAGDFRHQDMKDSKRFHSKDKIRQVAQYIKDHPGVSYSIHYVEADVIDAINIRQAVFRAMNCAINDVVAKHAQDQSFLLLIDGSDFVDRGDHAHVCIPGGDNRYTCIAAASILAKVAHDDYIADMCRDHPELVERYALDRNVGYGTKAHLAGIVLHGISAWHRKTFARCRDAC